MGLGENIIAHCRLWAGNHFESRQSNAHQRKFTFGRNTAVVSGPLTPERSKTRSTPSRREATKHLYPTCQQWAKAPPDFVGTGVSGNTVHRVRHVEKGSPPCCQCNSLVRILVQGLCVSGLSFLKKRVSKSREGTWPRATFSRRPQTQYL